MQVKRIVALVLSVITLCAAMGVTVYASDEQTVIIEEIVSSYELADSLTNTLSITSSTANCCSYCTAYSNVVHVSVTQTLQKFWGLWIWEDVDGAEWSGNEDGNSIGLYRSKSGLLNGTYRLKSVFTLKTASGKTETITIYSEEKTVS